MVLDVDVNLMSMVDEPSLVPRLMAGTSPGHDVRKT
jgi:hypothetical protein